MALKLKHYRVEAGLTQAKLAKAVGVSQPNYQRWESGAASIPDDKLKKLSDFLQVDTKTLLGRHSPIEAGFYDESVGEDRNYYGEVAVHFHGGGNSLLLSISVGAFQRLHMDLQGNSAFVVVQSLANQTVIIRRQAVSDLYLSSEAYDDYGPEHGTYEGHTRLQLPDSRDWEIIEAIACGDDTALNEFAEEDVNRISGRIMITDEEFEELVADGLIKQEMLNAEKVKRQHETDLIFSMATQLTYQLSTGQQRSIELPDEQRLFETFSCFAEFGVPSEESLIYLPIDDWHRTAFINPNVLDYVVFPTHMFERGRIECTASVLGG